MGGLRLLVSESAEQYGVGLLICVFGLRTVAVKKPYLTTGTNRLAEIVNWQLKLTLVRASVVASFEGEENKAVDVALVAVQVCGLGLAVVGAMCESKAVGEEMKLARVSPEGGEESDSAKIVRLEREKKAAENGREEKEKGREEAEGLREEAEEREKEAREEIERLKKDL